MYCINCGYNLLSQGKFCPNCGIDLKIENNDFSKIEKVQKITVESELAIIEKIRFDKFKYDPLARLPFIAEYLFFSHDRDLYGISDLFGSFIFSLDEINLLKKIYENDDKLYIYENGDMFIGDHQNGIKNGLGILIVRINDTYFLKYNGTWSKNLQDGYGIEIFWKDDFRDGYYIGDWSKGMKNGKGSKYFKVKFPNQLEFEDFLFDCFFEGEFSNDKKNGNGKLTILDVDLSNVEDLIFYICNWENDIMIGKGKFIDELGEKYYGELDNYLKHGIGQCNYPNGYIYIGEWKNNLKHGKGKLTYKSEVVEEGEWINDEFQGSKISPIKPKDRGGLR